MPEGLMEWFDPATGTGRIAKGGHRYVTSSPDVEPAAQIAGARVHFDVNRHRPGEALNVTSRRGRSHDRNIMVSGASRAPDIRMPRSGIG